MSKWRDIWKESIKANQLMIQDEETGYLEFANLSKKYGNDGMIHYCIAESYEFLGKKNLL